MEGLTLTKIQTATTANEVLSKVVQFIQTRWPPKGQICCCHMNCAWSRAAWSKTASLRPIGLHNQILGLAHSRHPGITVRETYWWPGLSMQVHELVSQCPGCLMSEKSTSPAKVPDIQVPKPADSWTKVGLDISGPFADALGHQKSLLLGSNWALYVSACNSATITDSDPKFETKNIV